MASKKQRTSARPAMPNLDPAQFAEMGKKQAEAMADMQKELIGAIEEVNREWAARIQAEVEFATEFAGKLAAAKSMPDTAAICQECMNRRMEMFADDSRRFIADSQKFMAATTRLLSKSWTGGSS
jgi:Phasin protein